MSNEGFIYSLLLYSLITLLITGHASYANSANNVFSATFTISTPTTFTDTAASSSSILYVTTAPITSTSTTTTSASTTAEPNPVISQNLYTLVMEDATFTSLSTLSMPKNLPIYNSTPTNTSTSTSTSSSSSTSSTSINQTTINAPANTLSTSPDIVSSHSSVCITPNQMIGRYSAKGLVQNSISVNGSPDFNSMNVLNASQFANITNSFACNSSSTTSSIAVDNYAINVPYGQIIQNGIYANAGKMLHYATYNGSTLSLYTINITKAVPNLEIKIGGLTLNSSNPNTTVLISPYTRSGDIIRLTDSYNLSASLNSSVAGNGPINYSYKVYVGGTLKENGNISATSVGKSISFANIPSGETSKIVFDASGNGNYTSVDPTVYYTTANTNEVISSDTTLGSDLVCGSLTIDSGITLTTDGYDILCADNFINNGIIYTSGPGNYGTSPSGLGSGYLSSYAGSGGGGGGGGTGSAGSNTVSPSSTLTNANIITWYTNGFSQYDSAGGGGASGTANGGSGAYGIYIQANSITAGTINAMGFAGLSSTSTSNSGGGSGGNTLDPGGAGGSGGGGKSTEGGGGGGGGFVLLAWNGIGTAPSTSGVNILGGAGGSGTYQGGAGGDGYALTYNYGTSPPILVLPPSVALSTCPSPTSVQSGQSVSCTATAEGGTGPFSYNWIVSNSITGAVVSSTLYANVASSSNTITYTTTSSDTANSPEQFNVIITQSGGSNLVSQYSPTFTITQGLSTPTISPYNPKIDSGQSITFSSTWLGGTPTYGASLYSSSTSNCNQQSHLIEQEIGLSSTSATFSPVSPTSTTYYCIFVTGNYLSAPYAGNTIPYTDYSSQASFSPSGTYAYVPIYDNNTVVIVNTATNTITGSITAGFNGPEGVAIAPSGSFAYVVNTASPSNIVIINTSTNTVTSAITTGLNSPYAVAFSPSGTYAYAVNYNSNTLSIIDTATNSVTSSISSGFDFPDSVSFSPSGSFAYVVNSGSNSYNVVIINTASNSVTGSISAIGFEPVSVSIAPSGTYAFAVSVAPTDYTIAVIDTATNTITSTSSPGLRKPSQITIAPSGTYGYIVNCFGTTFCIDSLMIIQTNSISTNSINSEISVIPALTTPTTPTPTDPTIYSGQSITLSSSWSGGTPDYTVKWYTGPSGNTCSQDSANVLATYSSVSATSNSITVSPTSTNSYCIGVTDSATTPVTQLSSNDVVFVNTPLGTPILTSNPTLPSTQNVGNTITFTASWTGGIPDYTANYLIVNTITGNLVANMLFTGITGTSNSFAWTIPSADVGNTVQANVIITDSASTPETTNSINSGILTINSLSPSTPAVIVPANILYYVPITFTNSQNVGITNPFQLATTVNSMEYQAYEASNLQNVEFFYSNGTIIKSWLEGNSLNSAQSTNLYTSENTVYWLNVVGNFLPASSSNTLYMGFASTGANLFNRASVGEAPLLSSTYGLYDNGNSVFLNYYNGASDSGWTIVGTAGVKTNIPSGSPFGSNAFYANSANGDYEYTNFGYASSENVIIQYFTYTTGLGNMFFSASSSGAGTISRLDSRGGANYIGLAKSRSWTSWNCPNSGITAVADTWYTWTILVLGGTSEVGDYFSTTSSQDSYPINNYGTQINAPSTTYSDACGGGTETYAYGGGYVGLIGDALGSTYITYWNGIMARAYPPNGIMPTASFGAINGISTFSETGLPNNGELWSVTYNGASLRSTVPSNIVFSEVPGSYSYSVPNVITGGNTYIPNPSSGTLYTANTLAITFTISASNTCTFTVSNTAINFGPINPGTNIATQNAILITNTGNTASNVLLDGSNWAFNSNTFGVTNTVWSWSSGVAYVSANQLASTASDTKVTLGSSNSKNIFFGVGTPAGQAPGTYSQTINIISSC